MARAAEPNVHNLAIAGTFDDCQALVKAFVADLALRDEIGLAAVNSINWARVAAQTAYYVYAALALGAPARSRQHEDPSLPGGGGSSTATLKKCVESGIGSRLGVLLKRCSGDLREEATRK